MFKRELNKYIVLKTSDVEQLTQYKQITLRAICDDIETDRLNNNKTPLKGVFVRDTDPIHDLVWKQLEHLSIPSTEIIPFDCIPSGVLKELIQVYGPIDVVGSYRMDVDHAEPNNYKTHITTFAIVSTVPNIILRDKIIVKEYNAIRFVCTLYRYHENSSWLLSCVPEHYTTRSDMTITGEQLVYPWLKPNAIFSVKDIMFNGASISINIIDKKCSSGSMNRTIHFQKNKENGEFVDKYSISDQLAKDMLTLFGIDYSKV